VVKNLSVVSPGKIQSSRVKPAEEKISGKNSNEVLNSTLKDRFSPGATEIGLSFSKHALNRLQERGIPFDIKSVEKLDGAINKAAKKGSRESLIISDEAAYIVNVPKRKVITAMDKAQMQENVFTNIDSTVIA